MKYQEAVSILRYKKDTKFALVGSEQFLKDSFISMAKSIHSHLSVKTIFPENQKDALDALTQQSFFDESFLILLNFDKMKVEYFVEALKKFKGCLILVLDKESKSRDMTKILSGLTVVECAKFKEYGSEYLTWIKGFFTEKEYVVDSDVEELIFFKVGPNMFSLSKEMKKLLLVRFSEKKISLDDVKKYVSQTSTSSFFDLFECLMKKDVRESLRCFTSISKNQDNFSDLVSFLSSYFEKMFRIHLLREKKLEIKDIADIIGIPQFYLKTKYMPKAISMGRDTIASKINELCKLSVHLRTFKGDKKLLVEKFLLSFMR